MKKLVLTLLLLPALWVSAHAQNLTTADQVVNAYFKALGGKKALQKVHDITWKAASENNGASFPTVIKYKAPLKLVITSSSPKGQVMFQQISDGNDVSVTMGTNKIPLNRSAKDRMLLTSLLIPELYLADRNVKTTLAGKEAVEGKEAYKLTHTMPDGTTTWSTYYDTQTGLKVKLHTPGQVGSEMTLYSDYREVDGIKLPFMLHPGAGTLRVESYQLNTGLTDAEFVIN